jgi:HK97 family phage prohead protease
MTDLTRPDGDAPRLRAVRDSLIRGVYPVELRAAGESDAPPTLFGHFAVFNRWTKIDSLWEGEFMESIAPGAFAKTIKENGANVRVLFNHGQDSSMGNQVLGSIAELREDYEGAYYEVPLYDGIPELLMSGLRDGQYGASFRFSVMKEAMEQKPKRTDWNPDGIPQRTIQEVDLREFGPVTWPAYPDATAAVRSLTDEFIVRRLVGDPERFQSLMRQFAAATPALSRPGAEAAHSAVREPQPSRWPPVSREAFLGITGSERPSFHP